MIILVLAVMNIAGLIFLAGLKITKLRSFQAQVDVEIAEILPRVNEVKKLQEQEKEISGSLEAINKLGQNLDFIRLFQQLTTKLPAGSYLDQIRLDKKTTAIILQGYTDDIGNLTSSLQDIGDVKLKSTSRRKDKTYFQLEITLS
jgi:Tfp pilus assembly protein PilN